MGYAHKWVDNGEATSRTFSYIKYTRNAFWIFVDRVGQSPGSSQLWATAQQQGLPSSMHLRRVISAVAPSHFSPNSCFICRRCSGTGVTCVRKRFLAWGSNLIYSEMVSKTQMTFQTFSIL